MTDRISTAAVVGLGYVGLPTAAIIASSGIKVHGVDLSQDIVDVVNAGDIHIVEPDLDELVRNVVEGGQLVAGTRPVPADVHIIAVPTPLGADKSPNLDYVLAAGRAVATVLEKGNVVILESTVPVGATEALRDLLAEARPDLCLPNQDSTDADIAVAHCPERVLPGSVLKELVENDRVIGGVSPTCAQKAKSLYEVFLKGECLLTSARTAELAKLSENAYRDVSIAFANELSLICDEVGVDVRELIQLANHHPRVNILNPGPGVGGHCIAVDPWFIAHSAPDQARMISVARDINDSMPAIVVKKLENLALENNVDTIACLGLAYKADIDDMRESPAIEVIRLIDASTNFTGRVVVVEPNIDELPEELSSLTTVELVGLDDALQHNLICCLVDHNEFRSVSREKLQKKVVLDTRGIWQ